MEPNFAQTVLPDKAGEPLRDPIRAYQPAELIDADIIVVFAVVAALEHSAVQVLLFPLLAQHFIHRVQQGQCAAAGFVFHFLHGFDDNLAVFLILNDLCVEQYGFLFPIYSRPPCAQRLAAAQPQAARQHDRRINDIPADKPQHGNQFFLGIVFAGELIFLRAVDVVKGIGVDEPVLESPLEGTVQDGVVVDNGVGDNARSTLFSQTPIRFRVPARRKGLHIMVKIHSAFFVMRGLGCHKFRESIFAVAVYTAHQSAAAVCVRNLFLLQTICNSSAAPFTKPRFQRLLAASQLFVVTASHNLHINGAKFKHSCRQILMQA